MQNTEFLDPPLYLYSEVLWSTPSTINFFQFSEGSPISSLINKPASKHTKQIYKNSEQSIRFNKITELN